MSKGLFDIKSTELSEQERQQISYEKKERQTEQERKEEIDRLKQSIYTQICEGNDPERILYTALHCIAIMTLTEDEKWEKRCTNVLDCVYDDLQQQSFLSDNAATAKERLDNLRADFTRKGINSINRQVREVKKLTEALNNALLAYHALEGSGEETTDPLCP